VDPAPVGGLDCFDGQEFLHYDPLEGREALWELANQTGMSLIAWDAPLSFDTEAGFYSRPIERNQAPLRQWVNEQLDAGTLAHGAVGIRPFAGCSHWALTCECLGMPFGPRHDEVILAATPYDAATVARPVIEVHPAVSMAVWWTSRPVAQYGPFPQYKRNPASVQLIWNAFLDRGIATDAMAAPGDDNQLDAWVAWKMGTDFLAGRACWVGNPASGGFVLPIEAEEHFGLATQMADFINNL
jgi:hypothetical protein